MEQKQKFSEELVVAFYEFETPDWQELARKTGLSVEECQNQWASLEGLAHVLSGLEEKEASVMTLNRLSALAREAVEKKSVPFWQKVFNVRTGFAYALTILVAVFGFQTFNSDGDLNMAFNDVAVENDSPFQGHVMSTTLDHYQDSPMFVSASRSLPTFNSFSKASPVSLGATYNLANDLDDTMFSRNLNAKQLEALFFRARKFEKQGYYREALKDYQFIAEFYPKSAHPQLLHIAMARCLEGLGQTENAVEILENSAKRYGQSKELRIMMEQLKTQTF